MNWAKKFGHAIVTPDMYAHGLPPLCTCLMAYRRTPSVVRLLEGAAAQQVEQIPATLAQDGWGSGQHPWPPSTLGSHGCVCLRAEVKGFESQAARLMLSTNPVDASYNKSWLARGRGSAPWLASKAAARKAARANASRMGTRLVGGVGGHPCPGCHVRQSDQEMIWFQLAEGPTDTVLLLVERGPVARVPGLGTLCNCASGLQRPSTLLQALRLLVLPEEYICPAWWPSSPKGTKATVPFYWYVRAIAGEGAQGSRRPTWRTLWGEYDCHATHFHHSRRHLEGAKPPLKKGVVERFFAAMKGIF